MSDTENPGKSAIDRAVAAYRAAGGKDDTQARAALEVAMAEGNFTVGDEVTTQEGGISGVIVSIDDGEAVISWSTRGESVEPASALEHVEPRLPR